MSTTATMVEVAVAAGSEPASAAEKHCTVVLVPTAGPRVIIAIICGELHTVLGTERIANVTRVSKQPLQPVVVRLTKYNERTVLGPVPAAINCSQVKSQLVAAAQCQLTE